MFDVQYPVNLTVQSTHNNSPGKPVHTNASSTSLGSIQPHSNYCVINYCSHNPSLSIARYWFIQLSVLGQCGVSENLPFFFEAARVENRTWVIMIQSPTLNHSTTALHNQWTHLSPCMVHNIYKYYCSIHKENMMNLQQIHHFHITISNHIVSVCWYDQMLHYPPLLL